MNSKKIFAIISTILSILMVAFIADNFLYGYSNYQSITMIEKYELGINSMSIFKIFYAIPAIILLIKYVMVIRKQEKYFDLKVISNCIIFTNIAVLIIGMIDILYYINVTKYIDNTFSPSFMFLAYIPFQVMYILLTIWLFRLKKEKKIKIKNN